MTDIHNSALKVDNASASKDTSKDTSKDASKGMPALYDVSAKTS